MVGELQRGVGYWFLSLSLSLCFSLALSLSFSLSLFNFHLGGWSRRRVPHHKLQSKWSNWFHRALHASRNIDFIQGRVLSISYWLIEREQQKSISEKINIYRSLSRKARSTSPLSSRFYPHWAPMFGWVSPYLISPPRWASGSRQSQTDYRFIDFFGIIDWFEVSWKYCIFQY